MKKVVLFVLVIVMFALAGYSQGYKTGIGFKFGDASGLNLKHFIKSDAAIEGVLSFGGLNNRGFGITVLYEIHKSLSVDGLFVYFGGGAHLGTWYDGRYWKDGRYYYNYHPSAGIDGVLGLEYVIQEVPLSIALDLKPAFDIYYGFYPGMGLAFRYNLK